MSKCCLKHLQSLQKITNLINDYSFCFGDLCDMVLHDFALFANWRCVPFVSASLKELVSRTDEGQLNAANGKCCRAPWHICRSGHLPCAHQLNNLVLMAWHAIQNIKIWCHAGPCNHVVHPKRTSKKSSTLPLLQYDNYMTCSHTVSMIISSSVVCCALNSVKVPSRSIKYHSLSLADPSESRKPANLGPIPTIPTCT